MWLVIKGTSVLSIGDCDLIGNPKLLLEEKQAQEAFASLLETSGTQGGYLKALEKCILLK